MQFRLQLIKKTGYTYTVVSICKLVFKKLHGYMCKCCVYRHVCTYVFAYFSLSPLPPLSFFPSRKFTYPGFGFHFPLLICCSLFSSDMFEDLCGEVGMNRTLSYLDIKDKNNKNWDYTIRKSEFFELKNTGVRFSIKTITCKYMI